MRIASQCSRKAGAVSFCMGGGMAVRTAAAMPERLGAVATLHDGALVTGDATGPRRLRAKTRGSYHFAIATDDEKPQAKD